MKKLFAELLNYRCITYALRILGGGRTPRTAPSKSASAWVQDFFSSFFLSRFYLSNGFIYVVDAYFIDKIEEDKYPGPKCLCSHHVLVLNVMYTTNIIQ